ncbi:hypothetical protein N2152v2_004228 [Parachlorella kessleri]
MLARRLASHLAGRFGRKVGDTSIVRCLSHQTDGLNRHAESWDNQAVAKGSFTLLGRYKALVNSGTLKPDAQQAACIRRLDRLFTELSAYRGAVDAYQEKLAIYQRARQERWQEAYNQEMRRLSAEAIGDQEGQHALQREQGDEDGIASGRQGLSAAQRRAVVAARAERRLDALLGPAPPPPLAPKGVYIHGSVGSGKSLVMDLLYTAVAQPSSSTERGPLVPYHRRLHFNAALLELHSRLHELDRDREAREQRQLETFAAAQVAAQQAAASGQGGGVFATAWQSIRDPVAEKLKRSKLAKLAYRRMMRERQSRSVEEHSLALAQSNAAVLRHAARALIRNCDTLALMRQTTRGSAPATYVHDQQQHGQRRQQQQGPSEQLAATVAAGVGVGAGSEAAVAGLEEEVAGEGEESRPDAGRIAALLCFDEVQSDDVFNIVALKGLMEALMDEGCVVVATSNRAPWELNRRGLHEDIFNHYIERLLASCDIVQLDAEQDYRRLLGRQALLPPPLAGSTPNGSGQQWKQRSYFYPLGPGSDHALRREWESQGPADDGSSGPLRVMFGRQLEVRRRRGRAAWFQFEELCGQPLGAADYIAISQQFHTVFVEGVPAMSMKLRDRARRFITLVDELYNHRVRLVCSAEVPPDELFTGAHNEEPIIDMESLQFETAVEGSRLRRNLMADGGVAPVAATPQAALATAQALGGAEERFAFARAVSRLWEMQSPLYLSSRPRS